MKAHISNVVRSLAVFSMINMFMTSFAENAKSDTNKERYGGYSRLQAANIIARTLFMEARSDYRNSGLQAVASVIWNRAGGRTEKLVGICFEKGQFVCWNNREKHDPQNYVIIVPEETSNVIEKKAWDECVKFSKQMVNETFVSNIGNRNMYDRFDTGPTKAWWAKMQHKTRKGEYGKIHIFGYLPERDGRLKG